ncbi:hypothetical protein BVH65_15110 [Vibrio cholerae]|nr:hypothetical protein [Vibrio cholerae]MBO1371330.1 hypothetical protein [Vibrio cholerae]MBO1374170.1 hypothetical protein [Vibrio cholerae]MBO1378606.1 hypothetical protein [Vibrio cholerae]MBO1408349.1 hypothetical protein [Vibrio cholerae]
MFFSVQEHRASQGVGAAHSEARTRPLYLSEVTTRYEAGEREVGRRPNTRTPDDRGRLAPLAGEGRGGVVERGL